MTILAKTTLYSILVATAVVVGLSITSVVRESATLRQELEKQGMVLAKTLAKESEAAFLKDSFVELMRYVGTLAKQEYVTDVMVRDLDGRVRAHSRLEEIYTVKRDALLERIARGDAVRGAVEKNGELILQLAAPVKLGDEVLGEARVGYSARSLAAAKRNAYQQIGLVALLGVAFGVGMALALSRSITRPLLTLRNAAVELGHGDLEQRVPISSRDEIGELGQAFNSMAAEIADYRDELTRERHALAAEKDRLAVTLRSIGEGVISTDTDDRIAVLNQVAEELTGYRQGEAKGRPLGQVFRLLDAATGAPFSEQEGPTSDPSDPAATATNHPLLLAKDGSQRPVAYSRARIRDAEGEIIGAVVAFRDVTRERRAREHADRLLEAEATARVEHKKAQELAAAYAELSAAHEALQETQARLRLMQAGKLAALGELSAGIAHELNQPISAIRGFSQIIRDAVRQRIPEEAETLDRIIRNTERMARIVDHIRTFARQEGFRPAPMASMAPVDNALELVSEQLRLHGIQVAKTFDPGLPPILGDVVQLEQVFINLLANARDALDGMPAEHVKQIHIAVKRAPQGVEYTVEDNGPGVAKDHQDHLFDPFFTTKPPGAGIGLGLSFSYGIVEQHHGEVFYEPAPGGGARFVVKIPAADPQACSADRPGVTK